MSARTKQSLLIELGTEELPPKSLDELAAAFAAGVCEGLSKRDIAADGAGAKIVLLAAPPRRARAARREDAAGFDRGNLRPAGRASAATQTAQPTQGADRFREEMRRRRRRQLQKLTKADGTYFGFRREKRGQPTATLVPEIVAEALKALPIPKPMRWGDHDYTLRASRALARDAARRRRHRRRNPRPEIGPPFARPSLPSSATGARRRCRQLARRAARRESAGRSGRAPRARARAKSTAAEIDDGAGVPRLSDALLDEIANLTEWPVAIACAFDREFLDVPHEALVMTMETNQKFVPVFDADGKLSEHFIGVANIESKDPARNPQRLRARDPAAFRRREVLLRRRSQAAARGVSGCAEVGHLPAVARQRLGQDACASPSLRA